MDFVKRFFGGGGGRREKRQNGEYRNGLPGPGGNEFSGVRIDTLLDDEDEEIGSENDSSYYTDSFEGEEDDEEEYSEKEENYDPEIEKQRTEQFVDNFIELITARTGKILHFSVQDLYIDMIPVKKVIEYKAPRTGGSITREEQFYVMDVNHLVATLLLQHYRYHGELRAASYIKTPFCTLAIYREEVLKKGIYSIIQMFASCGHAIKGGDDVTRYYDNDIALSSSPPAPAPPKREMVDLESIPSAKTVVATEKDRYVPPPISTESKKGK